MWHRLKNFVFSFKTYKALSPDLKVRQRVNQALHRRRAMNLDEWFETFFKGRGIAYPIANFVYHRLSHYSGLEFSRVLPTDRLNEDLKWTKVCWFDWELNLCDDFYGQFKVDISDRLDELHSSTVEELVCFLDRALHHR
jgi:hypothetical protein